MLNGEGQTNVQRMQNTGHITENHLEIVSLTNYSSRHIHANHAQQYFHQEEASTQAMLIISHVRQQERKPIIFIQMVEIIVA
ncbi:uncharacterized protein BO72DRAFT_215485 [Aspergillus fijiensis CBS 313.89]|uniref:Uncharacterized protein n=1 Tax=Aspergillus fijiensis CBS 313.89 TaxID=1448319 RepID=A0A8G1RHP4_9EURO|nr:uncharacterized protein BO72DRAFT_215485 [Aspergillus fijiensis CBS 313.89]RAK74107.1 hypothetical protein BO72DRAFT_215485 [Aspergillus fijiensis CBS 313.89]